MKLDPDDASLPLTRKEKATLRQIEDRLRQRQERQAEVAEQRRAMEELRATGPDGYRRKPRRRVRYIMTPTP